MRKPSYQRNFYYSKSKKSRAICGICLRYHKMTSIDEVLAFLREDEILDPVTKERIAKRMGKFYKNLEKKENKKFYTKKILTDWEKSLHLYV